MSWCVDQLTHQGAPGFDAWTRRRAMRGDMAIPAIGRRVRHGERFSASFERLEVVRFKATGSATNNTTKSISLENLLSEFRPLSLVQAGKVSTTRVALTHPTIALRSGRRGLRWPQRLKPSATAMIAAAQASSRAFDRRPP